MHFISKINIDYNLHLCCKNVRNETPSNMLELVALHQPPEIQHHFVIIKGNINS